MTFNIPNSAIPQTFIKPENPPIADTIALPKKRKPGFRVFVWLFLVAGFLVCASRLFVAWNGSLLDRHGFRQTQTALSAYYFIKEGFSLDYQTPVVGKLRKSLLGASLAFIIPMLLLVVWTSHADHVKSQNPIANLFTSATLSTWNYGSLSQKISLSTWRKIYSMDSTYGVGRGSILLKALACVLIMAAILKNRHRREILVLLAAFLTGPLLFTNLFYVHEYYYYEIDIYLELALGLAVIGLTASLPAMGRESLRLTAWVLILFLGLRDYQHTFRLSINSAPTPAELARDLGPLTTAGADKDVLLIYGQDWDSSIAYYSHRKCITVPDWIPEAAVAESLSKLSPEEHVAAVVISGPQAQDAAFIQQKIRQFDLKEKPIETSWGKYFLKKSP